MGHSFIGYGENQLRIRDTTLGLISAIVVKEVDQLPQDSSMYRVVQPLRNLIIENAFYSGYSIVIDLQKFIRGKKEFDSMADFLDLVISNLRSLGQTLPVTYTAALPYGEFFEKETWVTSNIIQHLISLKEILLDHRR